MFSSGFDPLEQLLLRRSSRGSAGRYRCSCGSQMTVATETLMRCDKCNDVGVGFLGCRLCDLDYCQECVRRLTGKPPTDASCQSPAPSDTPSKCIACTSQTHFSTLLQTKDHDCSVAMITADWCPPSRRMKPILKRLSMEPSNARVQFIIIDVTSNKWANRHHLLRCEGIPHFVFLQGQNKVGEVSGADDDRLRAQLATTKRACRRRAEMKSKNEPVAPQALTGKYFLIRGLRSKPELNGKFCVVTAALDAAKGSVAHDECRWVVNHGIAEKPLQEVQVAIKRKNLVLAEATDCAAAALSILQICQQNPEMASKNSVDVAGVLLEKNARKKIFVADALPLLYGHYAMAAERILAIEGFLDERKAPVDDVRTIASCNMHAYERSNPPMTPSTRAEVLKRALHLYRVGASRGDLRAIIALGDCYEHGRGVDQDYLRATGYYEQAADGGYRGAGRLITRAMQAHKIATSTSQTSADAAPSIVAGETDAPPTSLDGLLHASTPPPLSNYVDDDLDTDSNENFSTDSDDGFVFDEFVASSGSPAAPEDGDTDAQHSNKDCEDSEVAPPPSYGTIHGTLPVASSPVGARDCGTGSSTGGATGLGGMHSFNFGGTTGSGPQSEPSVSQEDALLAELRTGRVVTHDEDQDANIIISGAPDLHNSGDGHGVTLCRGLARVVRDAGHTPFHVYMVPPGTTRERVWLQELMSATVAIVLLSPAYFQSDACVLELTKLCMSPMLSGRIVPLLVAPVDLDGDFLGSARKARNSAAFIRNVMCGDPIPDPKEGCFQDAWKRHTSALLDRVAQLSSEDGGDAPSPVTSPTVTSPTVSSPILTSPSVTSPSVTSSTVTSPTVTSPTTAPPMGHMAVLQQAAQFVFDNYYSKPFPPIPDGKPESIWYTDYDDFYGVHRPNHGIANAVRKALLVPFVVDLHHKHYYHTAIWGFEYSNDDFILAPDLVLLMQVAMLFEVCGRESDIGFADDKEEFLRYHQASCAAFAAYASSMSPSGEHFKKCLAALERMYMTPKGKSSALIQHVFEVCHDVDLVRCHTADKMKEKRKNIADVIGKSAEIRITMATERAVCATGGRLLCAPITGNTKDYDGALFRELSLNPCKCLATVDSVFSAAFTLPTFKESSFKRHYEVTGVPVDMHELMFTLRKFLGECTNLVDITPTEVHDMVAKLDEELRKTDEVSDIPSMGQRLWTSGVAVPRTKLELCSCLNAAIRADRDALMCHVAPLARAINELCIFRRADQENVNFPPKGLTYRGGQLPTEHLSFFAVGKKYRAPGYVATSFEESIAKRFIQRRYHIQPKDETPSPSALWYIQVDPEGSVDHSKLCQNALYVHKSNYLEQEYLFVPYSVFTVERVQLSSNPNSYEQPHKIFLRAARDNALEPEDLPLAPWY
eukprot:m.889377 g.889377  ORF g.889377 m.889377 type:complete len:1393 (-) comp23644_c0_seq3:3364-7542(-)